MSKRELKLLEHYESLHVLGSLGPWHRIGAKLFPLKEEHVAILTMENEFNRRQQDNIQLIMDAVNDLPLFVEEVRRLREQVEKLTEQKVVDVPEP